MIESVVSMSEASIRTQKDGCSGIFQLGEHMEIGDSGTFREGLEVPVPCPHTLPYASLPPDSSWVIPFYTKLVI